MTTQTQIVHEAEVHRQHVRLRIPIAVEIDGTRYAVDDWSMGGVGVASLITSRQPGERFPARLIFPLEDFEIALRLDCQMVYVEPDLPRSLTYAILRPWRPVNDTIDYNEGLLLDSLAQSIINRRLESRARAGGSYLYAQANQEDVSRTADGTLPHISGL